MWMRLGGIFRRERRDHDFEAEVESHLQFHIEDNLRRGLSPSEARREALVKFGGVDAAKEAYREQRSVPWLETLAQDVRFGWRLLRKNPGFTAVTVATLALGIGANTAIFSLLNAVLLRSLPYEHPEELACLWTPNHKLPQIPIEVFGPSDADFFDLQRELHSFASLTLYNQASFNMATAGAAQRIGGTRVLPNFFATLGVSPELGRTIQAEDVRPGQEHVAIISHALWQSAFGGSLQVLHQSLLLDGQTYQIIGVMPPGFRFLSAEEGTNGPASFRETDVWLPLALTPQQMADRDALSGDSIGRLRPGVSIGQAQAELDTVMPRLNRLHDPKFFQDWYGVVRPLDKTMVRAVRSSMWLLFGAVSLVLLIACANAANLLLTRATTRAHEMGVRAALGAGRGRLIRQVLTEAILLACGGGAMGVVIALVAIRLLLRLDPGDIPRLGETSIDLRVLCFTMAASLGTGLLFGILPALRVSRQNLGETLKRGGEKGAVGSGRRSRQGLIVLEVAMAVVLLTGAGLLLRSYQNLVHVPTGFQNTTLTLNIALDPRYSKTDQRRAFFQSVVQKLGGLPGVASAGAVDDLPLSHSESMSEFMVEGFANQKEQLIDSRYASERYFDAMGTPLIAGRFFNPEDAQVHPAPLIVNQAFNRAYFPGESAVGKRVCMCGVESAKPEWSVIAGVVADVRHSNLEDAPRPQVYQLFWQGDTARAYFAVRAAVPPEQLTPAVRNAVRTIDPALAVADVRTMDQLVSGASARRRFQTFLLSLFAALALLLAAVGLYGLMAFTVKQRTPEIGVRMALGAQPGNIRNLLLSQAMLLTVLGLVAGVAAALGLERFLRSMLYGVTPFDVGTYAGVGVVLIAVAVAAGYLPARRAVRTDPVVALRHE
jgi:predicted permease